MFRPIRNTAVFGFSFILAAGVHAQNQQPTAGEAGAKSTDIPRLAGAPEIDGVANEAIWQEAVLLTDFHQFLPNEYVEPTQRTEVRMFYTEDSLYVTARMHETNADAITAQVLRQGQGLINDDVFAVILDPYLDRRNGYRFEVNANGVRWEALFQNINDLESNWDGIWEARATRDAEGWTAEMRIPFQSISFNPDSNAWGVNFNRTIRRNNESIAWVSRNREVNPSVAGTMTGLSGMRQGLGLDVVPSFTLRRERRFGPTGFDENHYEPQLDVFYKVTPQLNAALTLNTDFSATEVDDRQVNLTRFNLFFPEKRDFFLRDADIFEFGAIGTGGFNQNSGIGNPIAPGPARQNARPFFSRKIGLSSLGNPVDLDAGVKLSGRVGDWNLGTLVISQGEADDTRVESKNIFVGRVVRNLAETTQVGVIATHGDPQRNLDNSLIGTDIRYRNSRLAGGRTVEGTAFYQQSDTDGLSGEDASFGFGVNFPNSQGWQGQYAYKRVEKNFNPAVGFVNRTDIDDHIFNAAYRHFFRPGGFWRSTLAAFDFYRSETLDDGKFSSGAFGPRLSISDNFGDTFFMRPMRNREVLRQDFVINRSSDGLRRIVIPAGDYTFDEMMMAAQMGGQRKFAANIFFTFGDYYDGNHFNRRGNITYRPNRNLAFELGYTEDEIHLRYGNFTVRQVTLNSQIAFSATMSWSNLIQYDNVSENLGFNSRLHWIPRAGQQAFLVLNWGQVDLDKDNEFDSTVADLSLKMNYTFRF